MSEVLNIMEHTLREESSAIAALIGQLDQDAVVKAVDMISECKGRIVLSGCGTSAAAGRKIAHTFSCIECPAFFLEPSDAMHGGMGAVQPGDILILLSKGGETKELNSLIGPAKTKRVSVIGITQNMDSTIAKESDLFIRIAVEKEPDPFNMLATASILAVIAFFDALIIAIMKKKNYTREQFAIIHPLGAVGERLLHGRE